VTTSEFLRGSPEGTTIRVRVVPGAKRSEVVGVAGGVLRVRVAAPPVEGRANRAVLALLAERLGVRARDLRVIAGERGRDKVVLVRGVEPVAVAAALAADLEDREA
jgi:uncharacterized protein (TIGR00251 family)